MNKILIADDEPLVLELYQLQLGDEFQIDAVVSGEQALALLAERGPYAVVVADMHMPGLSGTELLRRVQESHPKTVRIMLTGDDHQNVAVDAVNEGQVFRFLNKPCPADRLAKALRAGLEQYRLVMAEKELLDKTLISSVQLLVEILSIINPPAFGRASRVCRIVQSLCERLDVESSWEISVAAMLSQLGCVSLPDRILEKLQCGEKLTPAEAKLYQLHPQLGHDLIVKIPRLERVAQIVALQQLPLDVEGVRSHDPLRREIVTRAGFLKVALDYDALLEHGENRKEALREMLRCHASYEPRVLRSLAEIVQETDGDEVRQIPLVELREGMVLAEHLTDASGVVLVAKGQVVTAWLLERLRHRGARGVQRVREPISVVLPKSRTPAADAMSTVKLGPLSVTI